MSQRTRLSVRLSLDAILPLTVPRFRNPRALNPLASALYRTRLQRQRDPDDSVHPAHDRLF